VKSKKETLEERVKELEAMVQWLDWRLDHVAAHIADPKYFFTEVYPKPDPLTGWKVTS
jgi:hypothetical protein